jgi:hypothetical protein
MVVTKRKTYGDFLSAQIEVVDGERFHLLNACYARLACPESELPRDDDNIACLVCGREFTYKHVMSLCRTVLDRRWLVRHFACCKPVPTRQSPESLSLEWNPQ